MCFVTFDFLSQMETRVKMEEQSPITSAESSPPDVSVHGKCWFNSLSLFFSLVFVLTENNT